MKRKSARKSAFFNPRALIGLGLCLTGLLLARLAYTAHPGASAMAQKPSQQMTQQPGWQPHWRVIADSHHDVSPPLRELALLPLQPSEGEHEAVKNPRIPINHTGTDRPDPVVQTKFLNPLTANIPNPILNFDGIPITNSFCGCYPPDTNGAVGLTQYVQIANIAYQVFNKFTGASIMGPTSVRTIWTGFAGNCAVTNDGDVVMLYDKLADRWLISQIGGFSDEDECIAISTTRDATGSYYRYEFDNIAAGTNFNDYPKFGAWPDAYYMSDNTLAPGPGAYIGTAPFAFDRAKMLCGLAATVITPGVIGNPANNEDPIMPSDFDGTVLPPSGAPNSYVEVPNLAGNNGGTYRTWHYHVDFAIPANSTFTQFAAPEAAPFAFICLNAPCVPQLGSPDNLQGWSDRLMYRFAYRNFGTPSAPNESGVCNFSVSSGGVGAPRWFELKNLTNGPVTLNQESTYQPDSTWRWLGSVAMDHSGDLAVGFSASSAAINPQVRYATRLSTSPLSTLDGEAHLFDGTGSQLDSSHRWGDYSAMGVDPVDDTTMWYTQEYYATTSSANWRTRIGTFRINPAQPLVNVSAKSELINGNDPFDIDLPLYAGASGPGRGVECRNACGGEDGTAPPYTIIFSFTNPVTSVGSVTTSCGNAIVEALEPFAHQVVVGLYACGCNAQYITVQLNDASDGLNTINAPVTFGLLIGDVTGNGTVNASDVSQTKVQVGMSACPPNFREDVIRDGIINASDVALVKSLVGTSLPTPP
jgi:hypothetical protein